MCWEEQVHVKCGGALSSIYIERACIFRTPEVGGWFGSSTMKRVGANGSALASFSYWWAPNRGRFLFR